jgi:hypothetical protein
MALHEIPAEVLRVLLLNIDGEITAACPYAFLLTEPGEASLDPHRAWLDEHGLLDAPPEQDGRLALIPSLRRSLEIVARPIRRIIAAEVTPESAHRSVHVSDGAEAVVAMFDQRSCRLSDPLDLKSFTDGLVTIVGPSKAKSAPKPIQIHPALLQLLGVALAEGAGGSENGLEPTTEAAMPLSRQGCAARLGQLLEDRTQGEELLESLIADQILSADNGAVDIHPEFRPWHEAITSGHVLEIQRLEYPGGRVQDAQPPVRAYFLGPAGKRRLIWPAGDEDGEVLLTRPTAKELKSFVGYLVGYAELT